ncbi:MAG: hypothetical protein ACWA5A_04235, partial [Marinibacterium sp.]
MVSEIVLHLGMHKTGSTSIQQALRGYDDGTVLFAPLDRANHSEALQLLFTDGQEGAFRKLDRAEFAARRQRVADQIETAASGGHARLILSGEGAMFFTADEIGKMREFFSRLASSLRVILYVREPIGYASSWFQQRVKKGHRGFAIPAPDYRTRIGPMIDHFGREAVDLVPFVPADFPRQSVVQDFARRVGAKPDLLRDAPSNESLFAFTTAALYLWNREKRAQNRSPARARAQGAAVRLLQKHGHGGKLRKRLEKAGGKDADLLGKGLKKFRFSDASIRAALDLDDVRWMEEALGAALLGPATPAENDDGITSAADLEALADATHLWIDPILRRRKITPPAPGMPAALDALTADLE